MRSWLAIAGVILMAPASGFAQSSPSVVGDWSGKLAVNGAEVRLVFHVKSAAGALAATFDSPDQGANGLPVAHVTETGDEVDFDVAIAHAAYKSHLSTDGQQLVGMWTQGGFNGPLVLTRGLAVAVAPRRPQTPVKPYPYRAEEVAYDNRVEPVHLAGTLTLPNGPGPFAAVLLITGSGLQDRDETVFDHHPFLIWADYLTRRGIAVLRVDDRQRGGSTGDVENATTADFATDVEAGLAFLRARPDIDKRRIGLMGHSEGGIIAPMVAARDPDVAFIVMLAGSGETGVAISLDQNRVAAKAQGMAPEAIERSLAGTRRLEDSVAGAPDTATARAQLTAAWQAALKAQGAPLSTPMPASVEAVAKPWTRFFFAYDPLPALEKVHCPVLALNGSKDTQVIAETNLPGIRKALAHNPDATVLELPGLNHLFQTANSGLVAEYGTIEETVSPLALKTVGDWMAAHTR
jgi:pimeloyl-ACP methyl ester carboxylesterase